MRGAKRQAQQFAGLRRLKAEVADQAATYKAIAFAREPTLQGAMLR
jgi:hypothetical protein